MPDIELDPSEYRLKGARRIKPFKKQPMTPIGNLAYFKARFTILAVICGTWAAGVLFWAGAGSFQDEVTIYAVAYAPAGVLFGLMLLFDE